MSKFEVNNDELKKELLDYIEKCTFKEIFTKKGKRKKKIVTRGKVNERLGLMIGRIAQGLSKRWNWAGYTWRKDFAAEAILIVLKYMHNYNPEKSPNAHAYITMICNNSFIQYIQKEKKHSAIKQELYDKKDEIDLGEMSVDYKELKKRKM